MGFEEKVVAGIYILMVINRHIYIIVILQLKYCTVCFVVNLEFSNYSNKILNNDPNSCRKFIYIHTYIAKPQFCIV